MTAKISATSASARSSAAMCDGDQASPTELGATSRERGEQQPGDLRIDELPRDVGWVLVYVGVLGVVLPGIIGFPFVIAGGAMLLPGGPQLLNRWLGRNPPPAVRASVRQIIRLVDDLERRYPRLPRTPS